MRLYSRINNPKKIDQFLINKDLENGKTVIVQFSDKFYSDELLVHLNKLCLEYNENFGVRFYGHFQDSFDCKVLLQLPNIKSLWVDSLLDADNLDVLTELKYLKGLSLGVFELEDTEILGMNNFPNLKELSIGATKTKAINLKYLKNCRDLNSLTICGHTKNIEVVGKLTNLEYLGLISISKVPLGFVNKLNKLKSLHFLLGGRENLDEIEDNEIETLEIKRVRGFNSLANIMSFKKLKTLLIEDQMQLRELHFDRDIPTLESIIIRNCRTFKSLTGLEYLSSLIQLRIGRTNINFDELMKQYFPKSLDTLSFYTSKAKIDSEIKERLSKLGYKDGLGD